MNGSVQLARVRATSSGVPSPLDTRSLAAIRTGEEGGKYHRPLGHRESPLAVVPSRGGDAIVRHLGAVCYPGAASRERSLLGRDPLDRFPARDGNIQAILYELHID